MNSFDPIFEVGDWIKNIHDTDRDEEKFVWEVDLTNREYTLATHSQLAKGMREYGSQKVSFDAQYCFLKVD
jgi:hypothetical protein